VTLRPAAYEPQREAPEMERNNARMFMAARDASLKSEETTMGIVTPRPAMRKREARTIVDRLRSYDKLVAKYVDQGMLEKEARAKAFEEVKKCNKSHA
jgi:hypothetical protein